MSFSFPVHSKQEQAKIALNNARNIQMAKLRQLQIYKAIRSKINTLSSTDAAHDDDISKMNTAAANAEALRIANQRRMQEEFNNATNAEALRIANQRRMQEEFNKANAAANAAANTTAVPHNKSFGLNNLLKKINSKKH